MNEAHNFNKVLIQIEDYASYHTKKQKQIKMNKHQKTKTFDNENYGILRIITVMKTIHWIHESCFCLNKDVWIELMEGYHDLGSTLVINHRNDYRRITIRSYQNQKVHVVSIIKVIDIPKGDMYCFFILYLTF